MYKRLTATGSCMCGNIKFKSHIEPDKSTICHCTDCQKMSGSAFTTAIHTNNIEVTCIKSNPSYHTRRADSGNVRRLAFCPECGTNLWGENAGEPKQYGLRLGALDEEFRPLIKPVRQIWCNSAIPWAISADTSIDKYPVQNPPKQ